MTIRDIPYFNYNVLSLCSAFLKLGGGGRLTREKVALSQKWAEKKILP